MPSAHSSVKQGQAVVTPGQVKMKMIKRLAEAIKAALGKSKNTAAPAMAATAPQAEAAMTTKVSYPISLLKKALNVGAPGAVDQVGNVGGVQAGAATASAAKGPTFKNPSAPGPATPTLRGAAVKQYAGRSMNTKLSSVKLARAVKGVDMIMVKRAQPELDPASEVWLLGFAKQCEERGINPAIVLGGNEKQAFKLQNIIDVLKARYQRATRTDKGFRTSRLMRLLPGLAWIEGLAQPAPHSSRLMSAMGGQMGQGIGGVAGAAGGLIPAVILAALTKGKATKAWAPTAGAGLGLGAVGGMYGGAAAGRRLAQTE